MSGRYFKIFLPIIVSLFTLVLVFFVASTKVYADDDQWNDNEDGHGSISVCKMILDEDGNVVDGSTRSGTTFSVSGITPAQTTGEPADGQFGTANFTTPLTLNESILGKDSDAQCQTFGELKIGSYYYSSESINPPAGWATPKYNDQFTVDVNSLSDFFSYDANLFDGNGGNDGSRNKNADGHIVLTQQRPNRTLIVLNQMLSQPAVGGGGPSVGGNVTTPICPTDRPQKVDQVWFTDVKSGEVTVHWANKGDAAGYHIAYGPSADNLPWGVEVAGNLSEYTLKSLPAGNLWVSIFPKSSADCGGPTSGPFEVGAVGGQVLGATGVASDAILFSAGALLIVLGLWQAQNALTKRGQKA